jgi:Tol biopolymer transport system component
VAFDSDSDILSQGIPQEQFEIWVYDLTTMRYTRVTTATGGGGIRNSRDPSLSANGARVAFQSSSNFPGHTVTFGDFEIFVCDLTTMQYTRVTTATGGGQRQSLEASLDADGTSVAFRSDSSFPGYAIPDDQNEIWLYDIPTTKYTRVTTATGAGFRFSERPSLNADGTRVAFDSDSDLLNTGTITDNQFEVWLYNTSAMTYTLLTLSSDSTTPSNRNSRYPSISANGIWVAFQSDSDFLGQGIPQGQYEIWLYDPLRNKVYLPVVLRLS